MNWYVGCYWTCGTSCVWSIHARFKHQSRARRSARDGAPCQPLFPLSDNNHSRDPCVQKGLAARSVAADGEASLLLLSSCIECDRSVKEVEYRLTVCGAGNEKIRSETFSETVSFEGDRRDQSSSMPTEPS